jgi:hypothetical protein
VEAGDICRGHTAHDHDAVDIAPGEPLDQESLFIGLAVGAGGESGDVWEHSCDSD